MRQVGMVTQVHIVEPITRTGFAKRRIGKGLFEAILAFYNRAKPVQESWQGAALNQYHSPTTVRHLPAGLKQPAETSAEHLCVQVEYGCYRDTTKALPLPVGNKLRLYGLDCSLSLGCSARFPPCAWQAHLRRDARHAREVGRPRRQRHAHGRRRARCRARREVAVRHPLVPQERGPSRIPRNTLIATTKAPRLHHTAAAWIHSLSLRVFCKFFDRCCACTWTRRTRTS